MNEDNELFNDELDDASDLTDDLDDDDELDGGVVPDDYDDLDDDDDDDEDDDDDDDDDYEDATADEIDFVIALYRDRGIVLDVDAIGSVDEVRERIFAAVDGLVGAR